jgi:hypothetical protein
VSVPLTDRRSVIALAVTATLGVGVVLWHPAESLDDVRRLAGMGPERRLPALEIREQGGAFAFSQTQPGSSEPVGWDPCEPVRYAVNPEGQPRGGAKLVERAVVRTSAATGLEFEDVGETDARPLAGAFIPFITDERVVIGWGDASEYPELAGDVAGLGGSAAEEKGGRLSYLAGGVVLDVAAFTPQAIARSPQVMEAIVVHELAHVVGLDHVPEPMEMMFDSNSGQVTYGPGDREGLARLGALPCR